MPTISSISALTSALGQLQQSYKTADTNADGALSLSEFEAAAKANKGLAGDSGASAVFAKLDTDHSGQLTTAELTQGINLNTQVQAVLLQGQELAAGSAFASLLGASSDTSTSSLYSSLLGGSSGSSDFSSLTSSLLGGGSANTTLASLLTGGNTNTSVSSGLFGGLSNSTNALIQQLLSKYADTAALTA